MFQQFGENRISGRGPNKRPRVSIVIVDVLPHCALKTWDTCISSSPNKAPGNLREESLDLIEPACARGREVNSEARVVCEPAFHSRRLVSTVVINYEMDVELVRRLVFDAT
jgi:hypothetical protein